MPTKESTAQFSKLIIIYANFHFFAQSWSQLHHYYYDSHRILFRHYIVTFSCQNMMVLHELESWEFAGKKWPSLFPRRNYSKNFAQMDALEQLWSSLILLNYFFLTIVNKLPFDAFIKLSHSKFGNFCDRPLTR